MKRVAMVVVMLLMSAMTVGAQEKERSFVPIPQSGTGTPFGFASLAPLGTSRAGRMTEGRNALAVR